MPEKLATTAVAASSADRAASRRTSFLYQDGVMVAATLRTLDSLGLLDSGGRAGTGYLAIAWRCLASAGWIEEGPELVWTETGLAAMRHREQYLAGARFLARFDSSAVDAWTNPWDAQTRAAFAEAVDAHARWRATADADEIVTTHLDATLALPAMLSLRGTGRLEQPDGDIARLLTMLGWLDEESHWTPEGRALTAFFDHFGMIGSYLPMLARWAELCRGELTVKPGGSEWHVHRELNVQASAAAHRRYFADADHIFQEIFSREPRPAFIADMGCGDGSWLVHLHGLFGDSVRYVGIDFSPVALAYARTVMEAGGISDPLLLVGDISNPDALAELLAEHGLAMEDGLHIRSFIDHDRTYIGGELLPNVPGWSSGAYVAPDGSPLSAVEVESDLVVHFRRWQPHVRKHGLVVLEAHSVTPRVARRHIGALHSVAFDAYHGLSHQYPIEHSAFMRCCRLAGLQAVPYLERRYPARKPFVAVSLNRLMPVLPALEPMAGERHDTWQPEPGTDMTDGETLHRLLYTDGDLAHPRSWCSGATGIVVRDMLEVIEARLDQVQPGEVIRIVDYGAGTGMASLELTKACIANGIEQRLADRGATFELHLVDIATDWFAYGFELLRTVPWTRFHAIREGEGPFRDLVDTVGVQVDGVMANMVFHLLTPSAMRHAAQSIAGALRQGGQLSYSSPDLGPSTPYSALFHDSNRLLRHHWLAALDDSEPDRLAPVLREAVTSVQPAARAAGQQRADRRILPAPQTDAAVAGALAPYFDGAFERRTYELLAEEAMMTALVPANQAEFLSEITEQDRREAVIGHLMNAYVLPEMVNGPAGTGLGINIDWTIGRYIRR